MQVEKLIEKDYAITSGMIPARRLNRVLRTIQMIDSEKCDARVRTNFSLHACLMDDKAVEELTSSPGN